MSGEPKAVELGIVAPQCQFFVQRKKRLCRMTVKPGRRFCGEHEPQPGSVAGEIDRRIPCPNDPKHTCYASKLDKHLKICNARRTEQPAYIVHNINAPETADACPRKPLSTIPKDTLMKLIDKVNHLYAKYLEEHIKEEPTQPIHPAVLPEFLAPDRAEGSRRHLRQASALLWLAERAGLVQDGTCYVELGAGKGQLSYYACHAWCGAGAGRVLAVDRAALRHKRDNKLRSAPPSRTPTTRARDEHSGVNRDDTDKKDADSIDNTADECMTVTTCNGASDVMDKVTDTGASEVAGRLRADLAHLALGPVPAVAASAAVVGIAKHLCGVATDYALRCVAAAGVLRKTRGAVLATCCHHRCARAAHAGAAQLQELGIDAEEFDMMLGVVSWATCGDGRSRERRAAPAAPGPPAPPAPGGEQAPPRGEREAAGRKAKALLDWGRVLWLREQGFDARLCYYVPSSVSLENMCIVARKR